MTKGYFKLVLIFSISVFIISFSCAKEEQHQFSDYNKFIGQYYNGDCLEISKIDNNTLVLSFYLNPDTVTNCWSHIFTTNNSGSKLIISGQHWSWVQSIVPFYGTLQIDTLTIDYNYAESEEELAYNKIFKKMYPILD